MTRLYCMAYGILVTWIPAIWERFGRFTDRVFWEIDNNDFLAGFAFAWILFCTAWICGLVRV